MYVESKPHGTEIYGFGNNNNNNNNNNNKIIKSGVSNELLVLVWVSKNWTRTGI